ncbi:MAG: terpene cyclase/mutase family protein [Phycisphaerae bacterium]|nr:terpene cyclase/mutase family protein [Phycisphaerae bacterium]
MLSFVRALVTVLALVCPLPAVAAEEKAAATRPDSELKTLRAKAAPAVGKALRFLVKAQGEDGGWKGFTGTSDPAITALVAEALARHSEFGPKHEIVRRGVRFVLKYRQPDGGIYDPQQAYANYHTSIALMCLSSMEDESLDSVIKAAQSYLKGLQWKEDKQDSAGKSVDVSHPFYGGAGYGKERRPDLSNTQMMVEALHASGLPASDPAYGRALRFITRCQMCSSNDQAFARGASDGGFIYTTANGGESKAGTDMVNGQPMLRSYGSMTYAGFKSMLYAKVSRDDPRVTAAWNWIRGHYTLDANPNMPGDKSIQGLFYYYHMFAKALAAWGEPAVVDTAGKKHDWRADLVEQLVCRQREDGSWINTADRWQEDNACLVTAYCLLALDAALR